MGRYIFFCSFKCMWNSCSDRDFKDQPKEKRLQISPCLYIPQTHSFIYIYISFCGSVRLLLSERENIWFSIVLPFAHWAISLVQLFPQYKYHQSIGNYLFWFHSFIHQCSLSLWIVSDSIFSSTIQIHFVFFFFQGRRIVAEKILFVTEEGDERTTEKFC